MMMMVIVMKKYEHTAIQSDHNVGLKTTRQREEEEKLESFLRQLNKPMEIVLAGIAPSWPRTSDTVIAGVDC